MLELIRERPNWMGALSVALTRPAGVPERRHGEDPWHPLSANRPQRLTDDLAWLRQALDAPTAHGLRPLPGGNAFATWEPDEGGNQRLRRLRDHHVLEAAGFVLFEAEAALT